MADEKSFILEAKVVAYLDGEKLKAPYRIKLFKKDEVWLLRPEQSFKNKEGEYEFNEYSGLPAWTLGSFLYKGPIPDELYTDFGQGWLIKGMKAAILEASLKAYGIIDRRPLSCTGKREFLIKDIEFIETYGKDSDYNIALKNKEVHLFRCSCCITFEKDKLIIQ